MRSLMATVLPTTHVKTALQVAHGRQLSGAVVGLLKICFAGMCAWTLDSPAWACRCEDLIGQDESCVTPTARSLAKSAARWWCDAGIAAAAAAADADASVWPWAFVASAGVGVGVAGDIHRIIRNPAISTQRDMDAPRDSTLAWHVVLTVVVPEAKGLERTA
ncbi:uncharacterized protein MYCFIDRAFT_79529 [Pseudocercospora fijiensis CIRAD86]|uniref:Uncharacterized protein n=1 Tax=Pseudocercospora fijiensis (strain CIRAD86) TaxID=383855 RepID=M2YNT0_PSEFD|nr:uncharacterized protein MYCFIDRAFT_79529 [Pseudocercospora fijiensis CIRAD86]EME79390.1 hypothetical protein MYCFIDRAFT_79529 [Pseudocercospora fijiensis CIRAD86]